MIFYEEEHVKSILNRKDMQYVSYQDLSLIARYLKTKLGKNKNQIYSDLVDYCQQNNPEFNEILARRKLKSAIKSTEKYELRKRIDIEVTKNEMNSILKTFSGYKEQKILFVMLILSKFEHYREHIKNRKETRYDDDYYTNERFTKILQMAKVYVDRSERYDILYRLEQSNLIRTTMVGSFQINFIDENSNVEVLITNLNDIEAFFPYYCINCRQRYDRDPYSKNQLCDECYDEKRKKDERERMRRARQDE